MRELRGKGSAFRSQLLAHHIEAMIQHEARQGDNSQIDNPQLLGAAFVLVIYKVIPLGCTLGKVYLSEVQLHLPQQLTLS